MKLVSGGTDNHLMLLDLSDGELTGKELERRLDEVYITVKQEHDSERAAEARSSQAACASAHRPSPRAA